jgi:hypothetical protein
MSSIPERNTGAEIHSLLRLLRKPVSGDFSWLPSIQQDWRPFAAACDFHHLVPFVFCRLRDLAGDSVPAGLLGHLRARFYEISARNYHLARKLVDLTSLLEAHHIPVLAYKGPAVAMAVYGELALRQYEDLDLVIRKEYLSKALDLMTQQGFRMVPYSYRCGFQFVSYSIRPENPRHLARYNVVTLEAPDNTFFVDLHWQLANRDGRAFSPAIEKVWYRAERLGLPQGSVSTFCREDLFLALCYHGSKHRWSHLKWLLDVAELLRNAETIDWSRIEEMIRIRPRASASASLAILLAQELLNVHIPVEAAGVVPARQRTLVEAKAISEEILLWGHASGDDYQALLALEEHPPVRMKYRITRAARYPGVLFSEVFIQVSPKDRALIPLPVKLQFLYHLIRPARLVVKHSRRVASAVWDRVSLTYQTGRSSTST